MRPLAIIESDESLIAAYRRNFQSAGFRVDCFTDTASALPSIRRRTFSLAILDLDLRDTDPYAVCREVSGIVPVIAVTAEGGEDVCVSAFEAGADDCVTRTLAGRELIARVRNVLRRAANHADPVTRELDALSISLTEMRVRNGAVVHPLSRGEAELLALLLEHAPTPLTVLQLAEMAPAKRATIESRIKSLRKKLGADRLVSRGRFGYELRGA